MLISRTYYNDSLVALSRRLVLLVDQLFDTHTLDT